MTNLMQLMSFNIKREETATDFTQRLIAFQCRSIAQNAPIHNRELRNHIMFCLKHNRFYKVDAAALEGTAEAAKKKLTLKEVRKHFRNLDKKRKERKKITDLTIHKSSELPFSPRKINNNHRYQRKHYANFAAQSGPSDPMSSTASTPVASNVSGARTASALPIGKLRKPNAPHASAKPKPFQSSCSNMPARNTPHTPRWPGPDIICCTCRKPGHARANCPDKPERGFSGFRDGKQRGPLLACSSSMKANAQSWIRLQTDAETECMASWKSVEGRLCGWTDAEMETNCAAGTRPGQH